MRIANQLPALNSPSAVKVASLLDPMRTVIYFEADEFDGGVESFGGDGPLDNPTIDIYIRQYLAGYYFFADFRFELLELSSLAMSNFMSH